MDANGCIAKLSQAVGENQAGFGGKSDNQCHHQQCVQHLLLQWEKEAGAVDHELDGWEKHIPGNCIFDCGIALCVVSARIFLDPS